MSSIVLNQDEDVQLKQAIDEHVGKAAWLLVSSKGSMYVRDEQVELLSRVFFLPIYFIAIACLDSTDPDAATRASRSH